MNLTEVILYKDTPFTDIQNTVHFKSNEERDGYFNRFFQKKTFQTRFNFIRDRSVLRLPMNYGEMNGYNYCSFLSDFENNIRYYAYIIEYHYNNDGTVTINLLIDPIMSFTQGDFFKNLGKVTVLREHLTKAKKEEYDLLLRNNDDIVKTHTKRYIYNQFYAFDELACIITTSVNLETNFGTVDNPKMKTSKGILLDKITSPLNVYVCNVEDFTELMDFLAPYPWITQNIKSVLLVPKKMYKENNITSITIKNEDDEKFTKVSKFKDGTETSFDNDYFLKLRLSKHDLLSLHNLSDSEDTHLLRSEYTTIELYSYDGQSLILDTGFVNDLNLRILTILGYKNIIAVYPENYKSNGKETPLNKDYVQNGTFLNEALFFNTFNDIPIMIDSYQLALAQNANKRDLAQKKLIGSRLASFLDPKTSLTDKIFNAVNILSDVSIKGIGSKITEEYEFYRTQKAEFADMQLSQPTITEGTYGSSFLIKNGLYGITLKIASPTEKEWVKIKNYYKTYGYEINTENIELDDIDSMQVLNFVQFTGNYIIEGIDASLVTMMRAIFENGLKLWHYNFEKNPMQQDISYNGMVK